MTYKPGERICFWLGDSVYCGVLLSVERASMPVYHTDVDTKDGEPFDHPDFHDSPVWSDMHTWRESDGPNERTREWMARDYHGPWRPPERKGER
jgi:hypothetical protein